MEIEIEGTDAIKATEELLAIEGLTGVWTNLDSTSN